ncbi:MAG: hypothetical protein K1000chlam3_01515 [Chlamydiae bacterium]|nr:hypothetical protein [Chlamydiota bacterium]
MVKARISTKRKNYAKNSSTKMVMGVDRYDPTKALLDEDRIGRAIWEYLKNDDPEGVIEMIQAHLNLSE